MSAGLLAPIPVWIHGFSGRVGQELKNILLHNPPRGFSYLGGSSKYFDDDKNRPADAKNLAERIGDAKLIIDFSTDAGNSVLLSAIKLLKTVPTVLIGTTGMTPESLTEWRKQASQQSFSLLVAPNTSLGVLVLSRCLDFVAPVLDANGFDIEIIETHHRHKKDAPSGTAKFLAETITTSLAGKQLVYQHQSIRNHNQIGVTSVRGGGVFGEHETRFLSETEEFTLQHRAFSRALFAQGALVFGRWLLQKKAGSYQLADIPLDELMIAKGANRHD